MNRVLSIAASLAIALAITFVPLAGVQSTVSADHFVYFGVDPAQNVPASTNTLFDPWYLYQVFNPTKQYMKFHLANDDPALAIDALNGWFNGPGGNDGIGFDLNGNPTFMAYSTVSNASQANVKVSTKAKPCNIQGFSGCYQRKNHVFNSTGQSYSWTVAIIEIQPRSNFDSDNAYKKTLAHEMGHAFGLHEAYDDNGNNGNSCTHWNPLVDSVMEGSYLSGGKIKSCGALLPTTNWDIAYVLSIHGFDKSYADMNPPYPYHNIGLNGQNKVVYQFKDKSIGDATALMQYYHFPYWPLPIPIWVGEELLNSTNGYLLNNGVTKPMSNRTLVQTWDPATYSVPHGRYVSTCARPWHSYGVQSPTRTCSNSVLWWP